MFRFTLLLLATLLPAAAQVKIAVINVQNSILETAEIKKAQAELEAKYKPRQQKLEALNKELGDLQNRLQTMAGKLTPSAEQDLQLTGQRKQKEAQRLAEDLQAEVDRDRNDILARSGGRMQEVVKKLAEEKGYDVVLDQQQTLYMKPTLDITKDATAAYDKTYPAK